MGQYWVLLNFDAGQVLSNYGKLGEGIFSCPEALVPLLQVKKPITLLAEPKPQYRERLESMAKEFGRKKHRRARPIIGAHSPVFDRFPAEIILMILNEMTGECVDCICLGLCSQRLWSIARGVIAKCLHEIDTVNCWAGDRLLCVGDYMEPNDLPPEIPFHDEGLDEFVDEEGYLRCIYEVVDESWPGAQRGHRHTFIEDDLEVRGLKWWHDDWDLWTALKGLEFRQPINYNDVPSLDSPRLLRNLTTHEYVHDSTLFAWNKELLEWRDRKPEGPCRRSASPVTLGHLCAIRICWSSEGGVRLGSQDNIHRGVWAAHRFDIVAATELEKMEKDEKVWKDVSREVIDEMEDIWSAILPDGWKTDVENSG